MKRALKLLLLSIVVSLSLLPLKRLCCLAIMRHANFGITRAATESGLDWLFIGSSMFRQGLDIKNLWGGQAATYMFAYNGNQPVLELEELRLFLERGGSVKNCAIDMYAYSLTAVPGLSDVRLLLDADLSDTLSIFAALKAGGNADWTTCYQMLFQANNELLLTLPVAFKFMNERYCMGANLGSRAGSTEKALMALPPLPKRFKPNPRQAEALAEMVKLCRENGTGVSFIETPKFARVYSDNDCYIESMKRYVELLHGLPCVLVINSTTADGLQFPGDMKVITYSFDSTRADCFSDLLHLSTKGRVEFSRVLAATLRP